MNGNPTRRALLAGISAAVLLAGAAHAARRRRGTRFARHESPREPVPTIRIHNYGRRAVTHAHVSFFLPFAPGEVPGGGAEALRERRAAVVVPAQQDQQPIWSRGGSAKGAAFSFV